MDGGEIARRATTGLSGTGNRGVRWRCNHGAPKHPLFVKKNINGFLHAAQHSTAQRTTVFPTAVACISSVELEAAGLGQPYGCVFAQKPTLLGLFVGG